MRPSHQFVAVGIGVVFALTQATPGLSQGDHAAVAASEDTPSLESASTPEAPTKEPANSNSDAKGGPSTSSTATGKQESAAAKSVNSTEVTPNDASLPDALLQPEDLLPESARPVLTAPKPVQSGSSKPTAIAAPARKQTTAKKSKPAAKSDAAKPAAQSTPTTKPINLADFKSLQQDTPITQAPFTPGATTPPPSLPPGSATPPGLPTNGTGSQDSGIPSKPIGPAKPGRAPDYLNPNPNPLTIPTRPEDVQLRGIQPITLQQALDLAKRNNRDLQVALLQLERSRASLREAEASLYPSIGTQLGITQSQSAAGQLQEEAAHQAQSALPRSLRSGTNVDRASLTLNGTVEVGYNIFTSGQRPAQIRAARQQARSDQLQVEVTEQQIRLDVSNAYYNLQEADEAVRIQQSAVRNAEASLRDTQALERAGLGTRFDVLRAQVQLANAQQDLTNALAAQRTRRRELVQVLAVPVYIDLAAADPVEVAGSWNLTLPQTIVLALKNRAELEQQLAQREVAEQQRRAALAALGPTVSLQVQYNVLDNLRDTLGFADGYSVSAGFNWNFFDGGAARARANQQEANKAIAEARFAQARENIQFQVESSYVNLQSTFLNIGTNRQAVVQAREALRLARLRFQAGVGTQTEVINAENDLTRAEGNLVTAIIGYNRALASLQRSVTNLPIPTGSTTPTIPGPAPALPPLPAF